MKKIFSFVIVLAAVAMVSCAGNANKPAAEAEAEATEVVAEPAEACDSAACEKCDSAACCAEAAAETTEAAK